VVTWEYLVQIEDLSNRQDVERHLNGVGAEGWELVTAYERVVRDVTEVCFILKRAAASSEK